MNFEALLDEASFHKLANALHIFVGALTFLQKLFHLIHNVLESDTLAPSGLHFPFNALASHFTSA
jgi:hypothetical protein